MNSLTGVSGFGSYARGPLSAWGLGAPTRTGKLRRIPITRSLETWRPRNRRRNVNMGTCSYGCYIRAFNCSALRLGSNI
jgi:hypothetical protein